MPELPDLYPYDDGDDGEGDPFQPVRLYSDPARERADLERFHPELTSRPAGSTSAKDRAPAGKSPFYLETVARFVEAAGRRDQRIRDFDKDIALLRRRLREAVDRRPRNDALVHRCTDQLLKALALRARIT